MEDTVNFYQTASPDVAKLFHINPEAKCPSVVLLKKEEEKLTVYGSEDTREETLELYDEDMPWQCYLRIGYNSLRTLSCTTTTTSARGCGNDDADLDTGLRRRQHRPRHGVVAATAIAATSTRSGCGCVDDDGDLDTGLKRR